MKALFFRCCLAVWCGLVFAAASDPQQQITELRREIARHDALYHQHAAPEISDFDYDRLKQRLAQLEREFPAAAKAAPPLRAIGDDRSGIFPTQPHREPMLSLDKAYTETEVRAFHARLAKALGRDDLAYLVEPKFDGIAVSVTFARGALVRALTRGNGVEGDDITGHLRAIAGMPEKLVGTDGAVPEIVEVRGEIYVPFAEFARVNAEREAAGEVRFANPRNLAAGTMQQRDPLEAARRGLRLVFYGLGACEPAAARPASQRELHARIAVWGLPGVEETWPARGGEELWRAIDALGRARPGFDWPTDGAVAKLDAVAQQRELGASETAPRWALAYKYAPDRAETKLLAITWQVGRTGVLTPVAELAPITLAGTTVARATLHNRDEILRRDLRIGDSVYVEKAGEIIPAVVGVNLERRPAGAAAYAFPTRCPDCAGEVVQRAGEAALRCGNAACPAQLRRRVEHFASRGAMNIEGLGPALVETLVSRGLVRDLPDLYRLRREDLIERGKLGARTADALLAAIAKSRRAELWRVIHGLGLPQVGAANARELARRHGTLERFAEAESVDARTRAVVAQLIAAGVQPPAAASPRAAGALAGKTFVLSGTLPTLPRAEAVALIEAAGGTARTSVTRQTNYLVAGKDPGAKLEQARALQVAVIDEAELRRLAGEEGESARTTKP